MLRVKDLIFEDTDSSVANKVAKLIGGDVEIQKFSTRDNLYVKVTISTFVSQKGKFTVSKDHISVIDVEQHLQMQPCSCMSYDNVTYDSWMEENIWRVNSPIPVEVELFYKFTSFTKKKMNEDLKYVESIIKDWIEECHKDKKMVMKYFEYNEYIGDEK